MVAADQITPKEGGFWSDWLTRQKLTEFVANVLRMERSVDGSKQANRELRSDVDELMVQVAVQARQLELLSGFINTSLNERIPMKAENAALRAVMSLRTVSGQKGALPQDARPQDD